MTLYRVLVTAEIYVAADSHAKAESVARTVDWRHELRDATVVTTEVKSEAEISTEWRDAWPYVAPNAPSSSKVCREWVKQ